MPTPEYTVLRDTREQQGWEFAVHLPCLGTVEQTLHTGDYTLRGYENLFVVERKASTSEIAGNIVQSRFERELDRLKEFRYPFLVCEFTWDDVWSFPKNSGIPPVRWGSLRVSPHYLVKRLNEIPIKYGVHVVLVGDHAKDWTSSLFKRITENVQASPAA